MTQKEKCKQHCINYLACLNLSYCYNQPDFEHIYRKFNGAQGNAYSIGIDAADYMIFNSKPLNNEYDTN